MRPFFTTFSYLLLLFFFFLLSSSAASSSHHHRKHLLQFTPIANSSISFVPSSSPSEIPSNNSPLPSPSPPSETPSDNSPVSSASPPSEPPSNAPTTSPSPVQSPVPAAFPAWCVAKPSAPDDLIQEAMDYACGAGGAECAEIGPGGACFLPDTVVAHASFAFNSYWQREKSHGGSCDFGGAAIVVTSDPSFEGCHFGLD